LFLFSGKSGNRLSPTGGNSSPFYPFEFLLIERGRRWSEEESVERELQARRIYNSRPTLSAGTEWTSSSDTVFDGTYRHLHRAAKEKPGEIRPQSTKKQDPKGPVFVVSVLAPSIVAAIEAVMVMMVVVVMMPESPWYHDDTWPVAVSVAVAVMMVVVVMMMMVVVIKLCQLHIFIRWGRRGRFINRLQQQTGIRNRFEQFSEGIGS
jgi:hypothetical protein